MSDHENDSSGPGIGDDQLPEDLVPSEDNPLAEGLEPDQVPEDLDLLGEGKHAEQSGDDDATDDPTDDTADDPTD